MIDLLFIQMCSTPGVHPRTTLEIIRVESGFNEFAINPNQSSLRIPSASSKSEAILISRGLVEKGLSPDLGLMQINYKNLKRYSFTLEESFEPCANIRLGSKILKENYLQARRLMGDSEMALKAALSAYNTGNFKAGFGNGYVEKFYPLGSKDLGLPYRSSMIQRFENPSEIDKKRAMSPERASMIANER